MQHRKEKGNKITKHLCPVRINAKVAIYLGIKQWDQNYKTMRLAYETIIYLAILSKYTNLWSGMINFGSGICNFEKIYWFYKHFYYF